MPREAFHHSAMTRIDFTTRRFFTPEALGAGGHIEPGRAEANHVLNVLRMGDGDPLLLFNGRDGEWRATVQREGRKKATFVLGEQTRVQPELPTLRLLFAPLKQARLEYMIQKAVEMGAGHLQPVMTAYTQMRKVNIERMETHVVEAAQQCGVLALPQVYDVLSMQDAVADCGTVIFCDEMEAGTGGALDILRDLTITAPLAVLIGPEGGFSPEEREWLHAQSHVHAIPLGPRILRADTAAVAALALVQAARGDWI
ncbi:surface protein [Ahrensia sp. R2A130]|nr:surface protein [Ahrensia sp. R2A130]